MSNTLENFWWLGTKAGHAMKHEDMAAYRSHRRAFERMRAAEAATERAAATAQYVAGYRSHCWRGGA